MNEAPAAGAVTSDDSGSDPGRGLNPDWYCPWCGTRLSYGIYCKTCEAETMFAWRPVTELDELIRECQKYPPVPYRWSVDDYQADDELA
jgi:hypothetical protein